MKAKILGLLAMGLIAGSTTAGAVTFTFPANPIPTLNFDLTGQTPGPAFDSRRHYDPEVN